MSVLFSLILTLRAQETPVRSEVQQPTVGLPGQNEKKRILSPEPPVKKTTITPSGLLVDIRRSTNRFRMFSLRRKADPQSDQANLLHDVSEPTRITGVKLLSIGF